MNPSKRLVLILGSLLAIVGFMTGHTAERAPAAVPAHTLDLRAPDVTRLYTSEQIEEILAHTSDHNIEEVEVFGPVEQPTPFTPAVWPTIAAPFWALVHPLQAWRIIFPIPPDRSRWIGDNSPDVRSTYLSPAAVSPYLDTLTPYYPP